MEFYAIYEQTGLMTGEQGILGIAPLTARANTREYNDSFVYNMKKQGIIPRATVGLFISPDESKYSHEIQIGDYNDDYVEGGEVNL